MQIESLQNPKIKQAVKLRDRRTRDQTGLFLIEGYRELKRAIESGRSLEHLFYCPELFLKDNETALLEASRAECFSCSRGVFEKISYRDRPDGLLAVAAQQHLSLKDYKPKPCPFLLIAERIEKPGNLGTILRSCDAAGVDAVIVCDPTTDIHNPNVVRSSVGTLFTIPVMEASSLETIDFLREQKILSVAATPHARDLYWEADLQIPLAIVMGTEQYGLTETWMQQADRAVRIPMLGTADSLNVASATTLLLYEVIRQRKFSLH